MTSGTDVGATGETTRAAEPTRTRTQPEAIVDTAEIDRVAPSRPRRISSPYDHPYEEPEQRVPAPMGLQIVVWLLFVVFVVGLVGLAVEHFHPSWIANFRNTVGSPSGASHHQAAGSKGNSPSTSSTHASVLTETASSDKGATYSVPSSSSYTLVVTVTNRCYIDVTSPPNSKHYAFASTIEANQSPKSISVNGRSTLELGAKTISVTVKVAGKQIGVISSPRTGPFIYTFLPSSS